MIGYLRSKRASTLVMTIIIIFIISMLGIAILSLAVTNYRARVFDKQQKVNFYLAESGTEETYAKLLELSKSAIELGNQCITDFTSDSFSEAYKDYFSLSDYALYKEGYTSFIDGEKNKVIEGDSSIYINPDMTVNEAAVKDLFNAMFRSVYKKYVNDNLSAALDISTYKSIGNINRFNLTSQLKPFDDVSEPLAADIYRINLISAVYNQDKDLADLSKYKSKEVYIKFELKVPNYGDTYKAITKTTDIDESPLWGKALAADKAIIVKGSNADVTVNGEVYAYGIKPADTDYEAQKNLGNYYGINLDASGSSASRSQLTINGNVTTNSYIMPTKDYSRIKINGNVFCNTMAIPSGVNYGSIEVKGGTDVYAADDIELNGTKSIISIEGNYYGFEDGEKGHDKSSSIVINSPDIDTDLGSGTNDAILDNPSGSMVRITGNVFLAGTVYINTESPFSGERGYQTGDSVAIRKGGNLSNPELNNYMVYYEDYALKNDAGKMALEDTKYLGSDVEFINYPPLYLAHKFLKLTDSGDKYFNAKTRSEYAYLFYKYRNEPSIVDPEMKLNLGTAKNIQIDYSKVLYSIGNVISQGQLHPLKLLSDPQYNAYRSSYKNKYDFYVNKLATVSKHTPTTAYDSAKNGIADYVDIGNYNNLSEGSQKYKELIFINNEDKPLVIQGAGGSIPAEVSGVQGTDYFVKELGLDNQLKGIVITTGDVYVTGELNYYGTIITTGNIFIMDSHKKTFNNTYSVQQYLWNKIYNTSIAESTKLYSLFKNSRLYADIQNQVRVSSTAETINLSQKYEDLLKVVEWKRLK